MNSKSQTDRPKKNPTELPVNGDREPAIARVAYEKWQARGCPEGDAERDWLEAESEVLVTAGPPPRANANSPSRNGA